MHAFGQALSTRFPLAPGERVELAGGVWAEHPGTGLRDRHVALPVYAIGATGTLGVRVALATPPQEDPRPDSRRTVALELTTDHESLRTFGHAISSLARGSTPTAVLHGHQR